MTHQLLMPTEVGPLRLSNRMVMAPMARLRAFGGLANPLMAKYYAQRATAGLIVTECTMVEPQGNGYIDCPGVYSDPQVAGWVEVASAVHEAGGRILPQPSHCGRVSHPSLQPGEGTPVGPSPVAGEAEWFAPAGMVSPPVLREFMTAVIAGINASFADAAGRAKKAEFDGVELHGGFGYLIDQFLQDGPNRCADAYGGSIPNRRRFCLEVVDAVIGVWGANRVRLKLSPSNTYYGMSDSDPGQLYEFLLGELEPRPLAYVYLMEPSTEDLGRGAVIREVTRRFRPQYRGRIVANGGFDRGGGDAILRLGEADLVSFGKPFLANRD